MARSEMFWRFAGNLSAHYYKFLSDFSEDQTEVQRVKYDGGIGNGRIYMAWMVEWMQTDVPCSPGQGD